MLARDKHFSLLQTFVNYSRKVFENIGPRGPEVCAVIFCVFVIAFHFFLA
jgi:hypothetical protein